MKKTALAVLVSLSLGGSALADSAEEIWKAKCKSCHGATGKADTKQGKKEKVKDISTARWQEKHSDEQIRKVIHDGDPDNEKMKPFGDKLTAEQIDSLVKLIRTFKS